jgi:predicted small lipoprotein YifL
MKRFTLALGAIAFILSFSACGQSGPLYLPGDPSKLETIPPAPEEGDEEEKEESEGG